MDSNSQEQKFLNQVKSKFGIIGSSQQIINALKVLLQAAPTDLTVLITGETGTGKEVFANALHGLSNRSKFPFVSINCGAIPETLLESELFGHEKGAFTGAIERRIGFFETANKGTIFLDEIGEMPLGTQVKLLRVLESSEFTRLGSSQNTKVDVRVIAATNRDLEIFVEQGKFRRDLFYRMNAVHLKLPELRNHSHDIPELVDYFALKTCSKLGLHYEGISSDALNILKSLHWPGNVRELKNLIDMILTLEKGVYLTPEVLRKYLPPALPAFEVRHPQKEQSLIPIYKDELGSNELLLIFKTLLDLKSDLTEIKRLVYDLTNQVDDLTENVETMQIETAQEVNSHEEFIPNIENLNLDEIEKKMIIHSLKRSKGNRRRAAEALGISERTLYRKLTDFGIEI